MIFGTRKVQSALGKFTSDKCTACKKSSEYVFFRITKYFVVFFVNLIPIGTSYECECINCDDQLSIDKKAGRKLAKQKFNIENSNQNFVIFFKLFIAMLVIAAAIVLPLIFVNPPTSPQVLKDLVEEDGVYNIFNRDAERIGIVSVNDGVKQLTFYNDISNYKSAQGETYTLHKRYEEILTEQGSYMSPIADDFSSLYDRNSIIVQRYYYDIANNSYGYNVGVFDLSTIEYSENKSIYPVTVYASKDDIASFKLILFKDDEREIYARFIISEEGDHEFYDVRVVEKSNGLDIKETLYIPNTYGWLS
jgi:hypothetical protein